MYSSEEWKKLQKRRKTLRNLCARERTLLHKYRVSARKFRKDLKLVKELRLVMSLCLKMDRPLHPILASESVAEVMTE